MELAIGLPGSQSPAGSESQSHLAAMPAPARTLAFEILQKVDGGGYASDLLAERSVGWTPAMPGWLRRSSLACCAIGRSSTT